MQCNHKYKVSSFSGCTVHAKSRIHNPGTKNAYQCAPLTLGERCDKCGDRQDRAATAKERLKYHKYRLECDRHSKAIHKLWHKFMDEFIDFDQPIEKRWKYRGYDMMERVAKFAKKHPEVKITGCDDSYHAGSDIVLVPHIDSLAKDKRDRYWGTTVIVIPQCDGQYPCEFFLYPGHKKDLLKALRDLS